MENTYQHMWDDFAEKKKESYLTYKFAPTHRVGFTNSLREEQLFAYLNPQPTDRVLDAGCASGRQLLEIADRIKNGVGVDIAQPFVDHATQAAAKEGKQNLQFLCSELDKLPFPNQSFDKVICAEVLEHVHDKDLVFSELLRVLTDHGQLIISVPHLNADATWWGRLLRLLGIRQFHSLEHFTLEELHRHGDAHVREFTVANFCSWMEQRRCRVLAISNVSFLDGPGFDFFCRGLLKVGIIRRFMQGIEHWLTAHGCFWGRHLVARVEKIQ